MNKVFKRIYYPVLFALAAVLFALGIFCAMKTDSVAEFSKDRRAAVNTHITDDRPGRRERRRRL